MKNLKWDLVSVIKGEEILAQVFRGVEGKFLVLFRVRDTDHIYSGLTKEFKQQETAEAHARIVTRVKK